MNRNISFQRFAAVTAIVSFLFAITSDVLQAIPVNFNANLPINPDLFLNVGSDGAQFLRWGLILDMLGYYLPLLPVALFIQHWLSVKNPVWVRFYTACGLGYVFIGALGAVALAVVQPPLISAYARASTEQRAALETLFGAIWNIVYGGMWNILGELLVGIWFFGVGLLMRNERRILAIISLIVGAAALADSLGNILGLEGVAFPGLFIYIILAPIWALWFGIDLLHKPVSAM